MRIDDDAGWLAACNAAHSQQRIIGERGSNADDDGIDICSQPMEMVQCGIAIDPAARACWRGNPSVERLSKLGYDIGPVRISANERREHIAGGSGTLLICLLAAVIRHRTT